MANDSSLLPPPRSNTASYAIAGVVLIAAAIAMLFLFDCGEKPQDLPMVDAGQAIERSTALAEETLVIPDLEPEEEDAGQDAGAEAEVQPSKRPRRVQCNGTLDSSAIQAVVNRNRRQVRSCYERALKSNNLLQGQISVRLTVGTNGKVSSVNVGGSLRDAAVYQCVRNLAAQWTFPKPSGGCVVAAIPFTMTPRP